MISEWRSTIAPARAGDRQALDELVEGRLPLVCNVVGLAQSTWETADNDVRTGPDRGASRYGLVRDIGQDTAPVPQYPTRETPTDPAAVAQRTRV
ncbi:hypothetical protein [Streptomyces chartreusis]|uniref:hypothetical protein n=1 Tax=Streptomyces chartreusis TaxID=1969 RepID=UPI003650453D